MHDFLGKTYDEYIKTNIEFGKYFHKFNFTKNEFRQSFDFKINFYNQNIKLSIEEIFAMFFTYMKTMVYNFSKLKIKDCIITIPSFYSYRERSALLQAFEMTNLKPIAFINDNIASSVSFLLNHKYDKKLITYSIFYNMGSRSTQASLIKFEIDPVYDKETNSTNYYKKINVI